MQMMFLQKSARRSLSDESERGYLISNREGTTYFKHSTSNDDIFVFDVLILKASFRRIEKMGFPLEQSTVVIATLDSLDEIINFDTLIMVESIEFNTALRAGRKYKITVEQEGFSKDEVEINTAR